MATTDWNLDHALGIEAAEDATGCQGKDLKALLNTIVEQLTDADRRHTGTLQQLQDRLSTMGREATSMRARVPDAFRPLFDRIEANMAELAERIAEATDRPTAIERASTPMDGSTPGPAVRDMQIGFPATPPTATPAEPPVALRSAAGVTPAPRGRDVGIDPFDIIESTLSPEASDPWDRDAADALSGLYEPPQAQFGKAKPVAAEAAPPGIDYAWLEQRFGDVSRRIEEQLADARPDQGFFSLGQRLEGVERQIAHFGDTVASKTDVEAIRLIEAHVSEMAGQLESTHGQLVRLEGIEQQLNELSARLAEVHQVALASEGGAAASSAPPLGAAELRAVARAAVEESSVAFAKLAPAKGADDLRPLVERMISETRAGDENTAALLDTLQQAMIRLLDRVDAMEETQQQAIEAQASFAAQAAQAAEAAEADRNYQWARAAETPRHGAPLDESQIATAIDDAVATVAKEQAAPQIAEPFVVNPQPSQSAPRTPDRIRQDFIADARRAKARLAEQVRDDDIVIKRPDASAGSAAIRPEALPAENAIPTDKARPKAGGAAARLAAQPTSAPRVVVMGLAAMTAIAGLWYALDGGRNGPAVAPKAAVTSIDAAPVGEPNVLNAGASGADPATGAPGDAGVQGGSEDGTSDGGNDLKLPDGARGDITPDAMVVGQTSVPLLGIAVDTEAPVTAEELERAKRRQTMAAMSTKLGHAAAELNGGMTVPAALAPEDPEKSVVAKAETAILKSGMSTASPLDMPPASVGPLSLRLAAANGDPSAQFDVGARLAEGKGTNPDYKEAARWYQRSADQGFAQSQYRLGTLYERGLGLKADPARAKVWYEKAATSGNIKAMHNLAVMSANQSGASPDYESAGRWFNEAAERGLADSQFNLAVLHENGLGVDKDMNKAYKWLAIAARSGDSEAVKRRDILKGKLSKEELSAAEKMIAAWRKQDVDRLTNDFREAADAWKKNPKNGVNG